MTTVFIAQVLGFYLAIMGLFLIFRRNIILLAMNDIMARPGLLLMIAISTLVIGLMVVASHNVWVMKWPVIITCCGWLALTSGLIRLFLPEFIHRVWNKIAAKPEILTMAGIIMLVVASFLIYKIYIG